MINVQFLVITVLKIICIFFNIKHFLNLTPLNYIHTHCIYMIILFYQIYTVQKGNIIIV